ncbi:MAG: class I SAM-dependent methyltransferase [Mycoplasmataceae bacterium]|jgi:predicted O-methyltransferase YrrM|nr:class I SAM-dependent methyltransferase [Mycoplasmataceae bacterium]
MTSDFNIIEEIKKNSLDDKIPIVREKTIKYICDLISKNNYENILEIGTAYGYSSATICQEQCVKNILTIEKNIYSFNKAKKFLKNFKKIHLINDDAFLFEPVQLFDLIFIDGPKSHQENLVEKYLKFLSPNGRMIVDNIFLKKIANISDRTKNQKKILEKVEKFTEWLKNNKFFSTSIIDIDDGIAIINK